MLRVIIPKLKSKTAKDGQTSAAWALGSHEFVMERIKASLAREQAKTGWAL